MSSAQTRLSVLAGIRAALGADSADETRKETVRKRLASPRANLVPQRANKSGRARLEMFTEMLEGQAAKVSHARRPDDVPEIVAARQFAFGAQREVHRRRRVRARAPAAERVSQVVRRTARPEDGVRIRSAHE